MAPRYPAGPLASAVPATACDVWDGLPLIARLARLGGRLRAADRRRPWIADIDQLCARARTAGPGIAYRAHGDVAGLDRGLQLTIYRIVQEALTNSLKHAGRKSQVEVTVSATGSRSSVQIQDSGPRTSARTGADPTEPAAVGSSGEIGHGLAGIKERVALYGGDVVAGPTPAGGWLVHADFDRVPGAHVLSVTP